MRTPYKPYRPASSGLCLCGSALRFRECCKERLPGFDIGKRWQEMTSAGRWLLAIKHARADICQYTIWHLSHTAPALIRAPALRYGGLMEIDIKALSDYVERLMACYGRYGWLKKLPEVLDRLHANIDDPRWRRKIAYQRGICALWSSDRARAAHEIEQLQPIKPSDDDVDLLQLHVDLHREHLGMSEKIAFFLRIVEITESRSDKLQYGGAHAAELLLVGDNAGARTKFDEVIALGRELEKEEPLTVTAEMWLCKALEGRAVIDNDKPIFDEIIARLGKIVAGDALSMAGRAAFLRAIGDAYRFAAAYADALMAYRAAFEADPDQTLHIFEADCQLHLGETDEAYRIIRTVAVDRLSVSERSDHAFTFFEIALARRDRESLADARELLKLAETQEPYFNILRLKYIVNIGEAIEALDTHREPPNISPILSVLKVISRYVQLKPSFSGIGLNVNTIIEDFIARAEEKALRKSPGNGTHLSTRDAKFGNE